MVIIIKKSKDPRLRILARPEGFEPPTFRIGICCTIRTVLRADVFLTIYSNTKNVK